MPTYLETDRMVLRRFTADDEDDVFALHSDPAVMRFLGPPVPREEIREQTLARWFDTRRPGGSGSPRRARSR